MRLVPLGINLDGYATRAPEPRPAPFTIGYFARVAPEKGLHVLGDAYRRLRDSARGSAPARLLVGGLPGARAQRVPRRHREPSWRVRGSSGEFEYRGELDRDQKIAFLHELDVLSVPATYDEPKGIFLLEAMASGVPVVQPRRGAFPEIVETTGGGLIVDQDDPDALADGIVSAVAGSGTAAPRWAPPAPRACASTITSGAWRSRSKRVYREVVARTAAV